MKETLEYLRNLNNRDNSKSTIDEVKKKIITAKSNYQKMSDEVNANKFWTYQQIIIIQEFYINSFQKLKEYEYYETWCLLEKCELEISYLNKHISEEDKEKYWIRFIEGKVKKIQSIYPYKLFFSPEIIEKEKKCSICNKKISLRNHCGHEVGNIYNGEKCYRIVTDSEFINISIVEKPVQKYSVAFIGSNNIESQIDNYNYVVVKYLIDGLVTPFDEWDVTKYEKLHPHSKFRDIGRNGKCPCGSNKKYKNCCLLKDGVLMPHYEFQFPSGTDDNHLGLKFV